MTKIGIRRFLTGRPPPLPPRHRLAGHCFARNFWVGYGPPSGLWAWPTCRCPTTQRSFPIWVNVAKLRHQMWSIRYWNFCNRGQNLRSKCTKFNVGMGEGWEIRVGGEWIGVGKGIRWAPTANMPIFTCNFKRVLARNNAAAAVAADDDDESGRI